LVEGSDRKSCDVTNSNGEPHVSMLSCDVCGSTDGRVLFRASDHREGLRGEFSIVRCYGCGLVRTEPRPDDLGAWYPEEYRNHSANEPLTVQAIGRALRYTARRDRREAIARLIAWVIPNAAVGTVIPEGARILDVGAGNGSAVAAMRAAGLDAWGVEPSEAGVEAARRRGVTTVVNGTLEASSLGDELWDVIRFTHVLEHVPSPVATLRAAAAALKPGGRVVILVPNFGGAGRRIFGKAWDGLEVPRHLHHFTAATIARTIGMAGLQAQSVRSAALFGVLPASVDAWTAGGTRQRGWGTSLLVRAPVYPIELALASIRLGDGLLAIATPTITTDR
jgi:2-polyprenyl-3-methyl-5-hydroxy-6-metoxy-1,4-benzoquinol methylase